MPFVLEVKRTGFMSENVLFNDAVRRCDTNQDGRITEMDARIFSGQK
jgi:hypothetical protein